MIVGRGKVIADTSVADLITSASARRITVRTGARLPISPWAGLGVLAAWAAGALVLGALLLRLRDA